MIEFYNLKYVLLLLVIPVLIVVFLLFSYLQSRQLKKFGDISVMGPLMPLRSKYRGWIKLFLICIVIFFFVLALIRPRVGAALKEVKTEGVEVMIALDVSNSMLASDFSPTRLDRAKMAISRLVDGLKGDRIGLIVFAGDAFVQLPVTSDYTSAKIFLNSINTGMIARQGTDIEKAIVLAMKSFSSQSDKSRALVLITDGENHEGDPVAIAEMAHKDGITIHTIGIGSVQGSPIRLSNGEMMRDKDNEIVITRLDQTVLQQVAGAGGGTFTLATPADLGLSTVLKGIKEMDKQKLYSEQFKEYYELYWIPLSIALILLVLEGLILERKNKLFRNFDLFKRNKNRI